MAQLFCGPRTEALPHLPSDDGVRFTALAASPIECAIVRRSPRPEEEHSAGEAARMATSLPGAFIMDDGYDIVGAERRGPLFACDLRARTYRRVQHLGISATKLAFLKCAPHLVAAALMDGEVRVYDLRTGNMVESMKQHTAPVHSFAENADGSVLISASPDLAAIWSTHDWTKLRALGPTNTSGPIRATVIAPDANFVCIAFADDSIAVWDIQNFGRVAKLLLPPEEAGAGVQCIAVSTDGTQLVSAAANGCLYLWDVPTQSTVRIIDMPQPSDGVKQIALIQSNVAENLRIAAGLSIAESSVDTQSGSAALGSALAPPAPMLVALDHSGQLIMIDLKANRPSAVFDLQAPGGTGKVVAFDVSYDARLLVVVVDDGRMIVYDLPTAIVRHMDSMFSASEGDAADVDAEVGAGASARNELPTGEEYGDASDGEQRYEAHGDRAAGAGAPADTEASSAATTAGGYGTVRERHVAADLDSSMQYNAEDVEAVEEGGDAALPSHEDAHAQAGTYPEHTHDADASFQTEEQAAAGPGGQHELRDESHARSPSSARDRPDDATPTTSPARTYADGAHAEYVEGMGSSAEASAFPSVVTDGASDAYEIFPPDAAAASFNSTAPAAAAAGFTIPTYGPGGGSLTAQAGDWRGDTHVSADGAVHTSSQPRTSDAASQRSGSSSGSGSGSGNGNGSGSGSGNGSAKSNVSSVAEFAAMLREGAIPGAPHLPHAARARQYEDGAGGVDRGAGSLHRSAASAPAAAAAVHAPGLFGYEPTRVRAASGGRVPLESSPQPESGYGARRGAAHAVPPRANRGAAIADLLARVMSVPVAGGVRAAAANADNANTAVTSSHQKLAALLKRHGAFPSQYRAVAWRFLLRLPADAKSYDALLARGSHAAWRDVEQRFPVRDLRLLRRLQTTLHALSHWSPLLGELPFLPALVFPFVKFFGADDLAAWETCAVVLSNWCSTFAEALPHPPLRLLGRVHMLLTYWDAPLAAHLEQLGVDASRYAWPALRSLMTELLPRQQWEALWDHLITHAEQPDLLVFALVAFMRCIRAGLLAVRGAPEGPSPHPGAPYGHGTGGLHGPFRGGPVTQRGAQPQATGTVGWSATSEAAAAAPGSAVERVCSLMRTTASIHFPDLLSSMYAMARDTPAWAAPAICGSDWPVDAASMHASPTSGAAALPSRSEAAASSTVAAAAPCSGPRAPLLPGGVPPPFKYPRTRLDAAYAERARIEAAERALATERALAAAAAQRAAAAAAEEIAARAAVAAASSSAATAARAAEAATALREREAALVRAQVREARMSALAAEQHQAVSQLRAARLQRDAAAAVAARERAELAATRDAALAAVINDEAVAVNELAAKERVAELRQLADEEAAATYAEEVAAARRDGLALADVLQGIEWRAEDEARRVARAADMEAADKALRTREHARRAQASELASTLAEMERQAAIAAVLRERRLRHTSEDATVAARGIASRLVAEDTSLVDAALADARKTAAGLAERLNRTAEAAQAQVQADAAAAGEAARMRSNAARHSRVMEVQSMTTAAAERLAAADAAALEAEMGALRRVARQTAASLPRVVPAAPPPAPTMSATEMEAVVEAAEEVAADALAMGQHLVEREASILRSELRAAHRVRAHLSSHNPSTTHEQSPAAPASVSPRSQSVGDSEATYARSQSRGSSNSYNAGGSNAGGGAATHEVDSLAPPPQLYTSAGGGRSISSQSAGSGGSSVASSSGARMAAHRVPGVSFGDAADGGVTVIPTPSLGSRHRALHPSMSANLSGAMNEAGRFSSAAQAASAHLQRQPLTYMPVDSSADDSASSDMDTHPLASAF